MVFWASGITSRQLPVNSSLPASNTMVSPAGNRQPLTSLANEALSTVTAAQLAPTPASAM